MAKNENEKKSFKTRLPFRLNVIFFIIFLVFSILIIRLGMVQIVNGETYQMKLQETNKSVTNIPTPRGRIYDSDHHLLAGNKASNALVFTRLPDQDQEDLYNLALEIRKYIDHKLDTSKVHDRDLKDYWIVKQEMKAKADGIKKYYNKPYEMKNISPDAKDAYNKLIEAITENDLASISKNEMQTVAIFRELMGATNLTPTIVVDDLTTKEMALFGEHLQSFDGNLSTTVSATRAKYPEGHRFYLGNVGEIPSENINQYLAEGYNRNYIVGTSGLEKQYEDLLKGNPDQLIFTTKSNKPVGDPERKQGSRGDDLVLTVNSHYEDDLKKAAAEVLKKNRALPGNSKMKSAYAVVMNPNTGGVLAMIGIKMNDKGEIVDDSAGTIYKAFEYGSAVKLGTVLAGLQYDALPGVVDDKEIKLPGAHDFSSYSRLNSVNAVQAIQQSSNVYMGRLAGKMAGFNFTDKGAYYDVTLPTVHNPQFIQAFKNLTDKYAQLGMGVHTGIDLPHESTGYHGGLPNEGPGKIMYYAIGQYNTYTPLQMAQYISTIANGGKRIAPHLLKSVHAPGQNPDELGPVLKTMEPQILNYIKNTKDDLKLVKKGAWAVTHTPQGTAYNVLHSPKYRKYDIYGKTGTAQIKDGEAIYNETFVEFAPGDDPQIAASVVFPNRVVGSPNQELAGEIARIWFEKYAPGAKGEDKKSDSSK